MKHPVITVAIIAALAVAVVAYMNRYDVRVSDSAIVQLNRITGIVCVVGSGRCAEFGGKFFDTGARGE